MTVYSASRCLVLHVIWCFTLPGASPIDRPLARQGGHERQPERSNPEDHPLGHNLEEHNQALSAIVTILDYSARLCQNPAIDPEQYDALKVIHHNSQILLNLVNTEPGVSSI